MNKLEKAIIQTLAFFDIMGRPLTLEEIWRFLYQCKTGKLQVLMGLRDLAKKGMVIKREGYCYLKNRRRIISEYQKRKEISNERWKKINWIAKILQRAPFVKNISVINSLSFGTSREGSDIDILLVAKKGRLWTARAMVILLLEVLGQNKNKWYKAGKFCLGFAFDEGRLDLSQIKYQKDIYFSYWLANLTPVFDSGIYLNLIQENTWFLEELPNWQGKKCKMQISTAEGKACKIKIIEKIFTGKFGDKLEKWLAGIQIHRILKDPENKRKGASVVADDSMLKLHAYDKRKEYQREWQDLTKKLILR